MDNERRYARGTGGGPPMVRPPLKDYEKIYLKITSDGLKDIVDGIDGGLESSAAQNRFLLIGFL